MKLTAFFILATCLHVNATDGFGQKVTLSEREVHVEKIFNEIKKQTGFNFLYASNILANTHRVTVNVTNAPVNEVLDVALAGQGLEYRVKGEDRLIIIKTKSPVKTVAETLTSVSGPIDVTGYVTDADGRALSGANVKVRGSNLGVVTDMEGRFSLKGIPENSIIEISYVGHEMKTFTARGSGLINIVLDQKSSIMDETVVVGYWNTTKRLNTGNVSIVKAQDIAKQPVNNPLLALQGRVPGLFITQSTGLPGSGVKVAIQGQNSLSNGNDPFYVIDGVPYASQLLPNYGSILGSSGNTNFSGNPLSFINPADIESISVLKDADATAIYGSRGANGVILITTKKGKSGQLKVDINLQGGWGKVTRSLNLLNTQQYLEMRREAKRNDNEVTYATDYDINGLWDTTRYTNWQKELIGNTARYTDINVSITGGNVNTQVLVGGGYHKETTVFPGELFDEKASFHFSMNTNSSNQKFRLLLTGNYLQDNNRIISNDLTPLAVTLAPDAPKVHNEDGTLNWMPSSIGVSSWINPLAYLYNRYKNTTKNLISNVVLSYAIAPGLEFKSSFGYSNLQSNDIQTNSLLSSQPEIRQYAVRFAGYSKNNFNSWIIEPQVSYKSKFGKNYLDAMVGASIQHNMTEGLQFTGIGYNSDVVLEDIKSAANVTVNGSINALYKYNALFGRLGYNIHDKYILNFTARRDGSSRFGPGSQFHNFGAVGIGWIFSKENYIQKVLPIVSFGKLSASYGTTGNDQIGDYQFMTLYYSSSNAGVPYQGVIGLQPGGLTNAFLQWEETKKLQVGLNFGLLKERILLTAHFFSNKSGNQLLNYRLPIQTGYSGISKNLPATVQNYGWEFVLNTVNIKTKNFDWLFDLNLTLPKNKLLKFPGIETSGYSDTYVVGKPITVNKVYSYAGVDPSSGVYQFYDYKGNLTSFPNYLTDRTVLINTSPILYGGIKNTFRYKAFELDVLFQFVKRKGLSYYFGNLNGAFVNVNQPVSVLDRWQKENDNASIQKYFSNASLSIQSLYASQLSDAGYSDASYVRLKNISLSYKMCESWCRRAKVNNVRFYVQGQNLATITNYVGLDPETLSSTTLPPLKFLTVGLQIGL